MGRGRPIGSSIRQNMIEILYYLGKAYGYEIFKSYKAIYPAVTLRVMYYHLRKGVELGEFRSERAVVEEGIYSWGKSTERIYYKLGPNAKPTHERKAKAYFRK